MWSRCKNPLHHLETLQKYSKSPWIFQTCGFSDAPFKKPKLAPLQEQRMIDRRRLWAKGGDGGNGCFSFHRSRHDRRGRADGGNGGRGGDVILECSPTIWDLSSLQHHINAKKGGHGASKNMIGTRGDDKVVLVPIGTVLHLVEGAMPCVVQKGYSTPLNPWDIPDNTPDPNPPATCHQSNESPIKTEKTEKTERFDFWNEETMKKWEARVISNGESESESETQSEEEHIEYNIAELTEPGQRIVIAHGGTGGLGNISLTKPLKNSKSKKVNDIDFHENETDPSLTNGSPGSESVLILELKSIADVGLVGIPNAGKSTLLGALSKAQPKIGNYAFTTLRPNLGNLTYDDVSITVADIPGLIKGAHENRGLGHAFLRHIERTKVLAYVVDLSAGLDGRKGVPPWEQLRDLVLELEFYCEGLSGRPALVVGNKVDETGASEVFDELRRRVRGVKMFPVCAVLEEGVGELKDGLRVLVSGEVVSMVTLDGIDVD
ncbi:hypothetical protein LXL04_017804 [Taraxacum kok-saghyz]